MQGKKLAEKGSARTEAAKDVATATVAGVGPPFFALRCTALASRVACFAVVLYDALQSAGLALLGNLGDASGKHQLTSTRRSHSLTEFLLFVNPCVCVCACALS